MRVRVGFTVAILLVVGIALIVWQRVGVGGSGTGSQKVETHSVTNAAITLWFEGNESDALNLILSSNVDSEVAMRAIIELELNETEFMKLSNRQKTASNETNIALFSAVMALARAMLDKADEARLQGNEADAERIIGQIRSMSAELSAPRHTLMIQRIGRSILKLLED